MFGVPGASVNLGDRQKSLKRIESGVLNLKKEKSEKVCENSELEKMRERISAINDERYQQPVFLKVPFFSPKSN